MTSSHTPPGSSHHKLLTILLWIRLTPPGSYFPCLVCLSLLSSSSSIISLCWLPQAPIEYSAQLQCLPYLLKLYVYEQASPTMHRDPRTLMYCFISSSWHLALYLKHGPSLNVCWINEFHLIMPPFHQKQNTEVRLPCFQGFSQPWYAMIVRSCLKNHGDKEPRVYRPKQTQMLTSCLTDKSRLLFAAEPHNSASCDIPMREFSLGISGFAQDHISLTHYPE